MGKPLNVLSLFDGISCGQIALQRAGIPVDKYFASEVDKHAIAVTQHNYPDTIQLGDVTKWREWDLPQIDLICAGSPCTGFSFAGKQLNFNDPQSKLFFEFVDILESIRKKNPNVKFLLENVKMKKEYQDKISEILGVQPVMINSSRLSAQNRVRYYWSNFGEINQPEDLKIPLASIIEESYDGIWVWPRGTNKGGVKNYNGKSPSVTVSSWQHNFLIYKGAALRYRYENSKPFCSLETRKDDKSNAVVTCTDKYLLEKSGQIRKFTVSEVEKLQTVPLGYSSVISDNQRYKCLGNGRTVDVIAHIFKNLKENGFT
jgi:DNA-cytosine methyltransferase